MTSPLIVRRARAEDSLAIARIHVETWRSTYAGLLPDAYLTGMAQGDSAIEWARRLSFAKQRGTTLAAAQGDEVVGFVSCGAQAGAEERYQGEVYALYVAEDWQNQGIGRALLTGAFETLAKSGRGSALVWVLSQNPARFFYEALGGKLTAQRLEKFAGVQLEETAYGWGDLEAWLAAL